MTSTKPIDLKEIKNLIDDDLDYALDFAEFIISEKVSFYNTRVAAGLRQFQEKLSKANSPFLKTSETLKHQNNLLRLIINWNPAISSQLLSVVNFYVDINKMMTRPVTLREVNPIELVIQNRDKFERARSNYMQKSN